MPQTHASVADVLSALSKALRNLRIPWYIFGAQALVLRGFPRATADLDVTILLGTTPTHSLVRALGEHGFVLAFGDAQFVAATRVLPFLHKTSGFPVDIVLGGPGLEEHFASAAEPVKVGRLRVPVATATHLVVMKVLAGRPKDLEDATALLAMQANQIDHRELRSLTRQLSAALSEDDILERLSDVKGRASRLRRRS